MFNPGRNDKVVYHVQYYLKYIRKWFTDDVFDTKDEALAYLATCRKYNSRREYRLAEAVTRYIVLPN